MHTTSFSVIEDKSTRIKELRTAIANAGSVVEAPAFWTRIANDESYSIQHRHLCISALLRRHVHAGMRLARLKTALEGSKWLKEEDVEEVTVVTGQIPFKYEYGEFSTFCFRILPQPQEDVDGFFIRVKGKITLRELLNFLLNGQDSGSIANVGIHAIYYGDF